MNGAYSGLLRSKHIRNAVIVPVRNTDTDKNDKPTGSKRLKREHSRSVKRR